MASRVQPERQRKATKADYLETAAGNKISRKANLQGLEHIVLLGNVVIQHQACLRGDLVRLDATPPAVGATQLPPTKRTSITIGRYSVICSGATLRPPHRITSTAGMTFLPMTVGSNVYIGAGAHVAAASIGSNTYIESGVVLGNASILGERVKICEGAIVPDGMAIPSGFIVAGRPARVVGEVGDGWGMGTAFGGLEEGEWEEGGELKELVKSVK